MAERPDVEFVLVPFELRVDMPDEGYQMSELEAAGHSDRVEDHLMKVAARDGFPMVVPPFLPKTHLALALAEIGRNQGDVAHRAIHAAVFDAYFGRGLDIGSREVLLGVAKAQGYDLDEVGRVWDEGVYDERLHQFRHVGISLGLDSTPAALICNELLIGSRPYQVLKDAVDRCLIDAGNIEAEVAEPV